jgi:hypothetical protein
MEIKIGKSARACCATERDFVHGEQVVSLVRIENQVYVREDYAEEAWNPDKAEGAIAVWTMTYIDPKVAEQEPEESYSPLRQIFYESAVDHERPLLATAYLAAELLRRQKVFRLVKQGVEGEVEGRVALYNDRIANRLVEVRDPNLSIAELEVGRQRLLQRLQELEAPDEVEDAGGAAKDEQAAQTGSQIDESAGDDSEDNPDVSGSDIDEYSNEASEDFEYEDAMHTERVANGDA